MYIRKLILVFLIIYLSISQALTDSHKNKNVLGDNNAINTLVEYASMSCVHCANFHNNDLPKIKSNLIDNGKLKFIYKDFPLDRPAMYASMIAHCFSGEQYFEVLSSLYRNQKKWVSVADTSGKFYSSLHNILKIHDITLDKIIECVDDKSEINKKKWNNILASRLEGQNMGVNSTPTFFLNGKKIEKPVNFEVLNEMISE
tara:strand:- start:346 stop:948 length:603 start_codon:yes stop_codon:yes gene_type:complete